MVGRPKTRAKKALGLAEKSSAEVTRPKASADLIISHALGGLFTEKDFAKVDKAIGHSGLPKNTQEHLKRRLRTVYAPELVEEIKEIDRSAFIKALERKRWAILSAISPQKIEEAGLRDLAVAYATLQDKQALLMGEPTAIISFERTEKLDKLGQLLVGEMKHRGIVDLEQKPDGSYGEGTD